MSVPETTTLCADASYSTEAEGRAAHEAGKQHRDCPYLRGEDRWAWDLGWIAAEGKHALIANIVEQSDYPGEAAERIAAALGVSFAEGWALAQKEIDR